MFKYYNNFFGQFGGRYVAEILRNPLDRLEEAFLDVMNNKEFLDEYNYLARYYSGRPTPLMYAENSSKALGGSKIYIKLEGLANTGAHKINNVIGQCLLAKQMGKKRIIAETGAGQHGVATAAVCARLGFECCVYMGEVDIRRQRPNVFWMQRYGAKVIPVSSGSKTLKDAVNEALRDWASSFEDTYYLLGSCLGPSPYPDMVREFQSIIGKEVEEEIEKQKIDVEAIIACVGGGSNSLGIFSPFIDKACPRLIGVEAGGRGTGPGEHAARMNGSGELGIVQGYKSLFLLDEDGQVMQTHSISAGLDYPGVGPQLAHLGQTGRVEFRRAEDKEALEAVDFFARHEGIIFALESAHAGAEAIKMAGKLPKEKALIVNMSGRGDKDIFIMAPEMDRDNWIDFLKEEIVRYAG
jgi:tryptophan synthase beta chain